MSVGVRGSGRYKPKAGESKFLSGRKVWELSLRARNTLPPPPCPVMGEKKKLQENPSGGIQDSARAKIRC